MSPILLTKSGRQTGAPTRIPLFPHGIMALSGLAILGGCGWGVVNIMELIDLRTAAGLTLNVPHLPWALTGDGGVD
ncbi:MAG: hypothetical protein JWP57_4485 [Spirosoma sp.]|nr:hypothetical protein [Spirosoma sp.]